MDERSTDTGPSANDARPGNTDTGRINQKLRTRQALVEAARALVASGASPTLAEVAEHALISKATAYRYFASSDALIAEVFFDQYFPTADDVLGDVGDDPTQRVLAVEKAVTDTMLAHENAMRMIIRNALDAALGSTDDAPQRTGRRTPLITAALQPLERTLSAEALQRLGHALALVIGPEAIIAARDVCGLSPDETREVTRFAAEAILSHALPPTKRTRR